LHSLVDRFGGDVKVITQPVPGLVEHIEEADLDGPELRRMVEGYVRPMLDAGADTIVLGSTHYVFLRPVLSEIAAPGCFGSAASRLRRTPGASSASGPAATLPPPSG
jgi:glutamate racemase